MLRAMLVCVDMPQNCQEWRQHRDSFRARTSMVVPDEQLCLGAKASCWAPGSYFDLAEG